MSTQTLTQPVTCALPGGDVDHYYCCDENLALCGVDLSAVVEGREFPSMCPLCEVADDYACPRCGQ